MTRIEEIAARLEAMGDDRQSHKEWRAATDAFNANSRHDIAYLLEEVKRLRGERGRMFPVIDSAVEWWRGSSLSGRRADDLSDACHAYVNFAADASGMGPGDDGGETISVPRGLWHWTLRVEADLREKLADRTTAADGAEALALSLSEALDTLKLWSLCTSELMKEQKRDAAMSAVDAALSDPRLLKLRGKQ